jgi:uncharacterized coiled-coil protein SlyX
MDKQEDFSHMERCIKQMQQHVSEQDAEIFRVTKRLDAALKRIEKLEGRLDASGSESPIDTDNSPRDEIPPHY